jgi:adenine-specific DNA-methyltransferase
VIRSELDVLLDKVQDPSLRADLQAQVDRLKQRRSFGLVFEQHIPERVCLPQHPIRVGSQVVDRDDDDSSTWEVILIEGDVATMVQVRDRDGAFVGRVDEPEMRDAPVGSLVVISDFGDPVLPGLRHLGSVERGGDKPYHLVIKGENHHALEALRFTHAGKVDCIYIDPPYNSGARDWKYNNDYVDDNDAYRHSKWLAFMERRLRLAKELLNPEDSVLIVTIDEKEYLRLGMLLEQMFPQAHLEMVTSVISGKGVARFGQFSRVEEYIFTLRFGAQEVALSETNMLDGARSASERVGQSVDWLGLRRREPTARRGARPRQFYPVFIDAATGYVHSIGDAITNGVDRASVDAPAGTFAVWPLLPEGTEGLWGITPETARAHLASGFLRSRNYRPDTGYVAVQYLPGGTVSNIEAGAIQVLGRDQDGSVIAEHKSAKGVIPKRVWTMASHNAETGGTTLVSRLLPRQRFPFPKSLYAVEDTVRFFVLDKPGAVVLDFFAGSGTTAHAVARLNKQDGGRRQSIMITNNEVSADEGKALRARGVRPGDPEWEALGIFEDITRPRVTAAVTGKTPDGEPIKGDYRFTDEFPMADGFEENVAFLELRYLDADDVDLGLAYDDIATLLWLRAGGQGPIASRVDDAGTPLPFAWTDTYGVLFDEDRWRAFVSERPGSANTVFIVTYSPTAFAGIVAELPPAMDVVRLPDTYLSMFARDRGRA